MQLTLVTDEKVVKIPTPPPSTIKCHDHVVQFYESEEYLSKAVTQFITVGLAADEAVIIIASHEHEEYFRRDLVNILPTMEKKIESGQLVFLNARETLAEFMVEGLPDFNKFKKVIGNLIEKTTVKFPKTRAYGEMVDLLRFDGNLKGMIELEEQWNNLAKDYAFALLCGYQMNGFSDVNAAESFQHVCNKHTHVLPSESYSALDNSDDQLREIAHLQQQAQMLQLELKRRLQTEELLLKSEAELRLAVRSRDEFLSIASHELKTPITTLMLQAQAQLRRLEQNDPTVVERKSVAKLVETTNRQAERLSKLVDDMLDISRIEHGKLAIQPEKVNLGILVRDVLERFDDQLRTAGCKSRVTIESSVEGNWDRYRLEQVVINLITNVLKYAPGKPVEISVTSKDTKAFVTFKDQGIGIANEQLEKVFKRFERLSPSSHVSGLGLGLFISKQIIDAHKGSINVASKIGEGSTFTFELPMQPYFAQ